MTGSTGGFVEEFLREAERKPQKGFATCRNERITLFDLHRRSGSLANALVDMGIEAGHRVVVMMRNSPRSLCVMFGLGRFGVIWVPANVQLKGDGLRYLIEHSDPKAIICDEAFLDALAECGADLERITTIATGRDEGTIPLEELLRKEAAFVGTCPRRTTCSQSCTRPALPAVPRA